MFFSLDTQFTITYLVPSVKAGRHMSSLKPPLFQAWFNDHTFHPRLQWK